MNKVFTAGYSGHTPAQLKKAAEELNARVLDIRFSRRSRQLGWNEAELQRVLNWRYVPVPTLGNVNYSTGAPIQLHAPKLGCDIVCDLLRGHSLILICGCRDFDECHRANVAALLQERGVASQELVWPELETPGTMKALSIKQPWAWLIVNGHKDVENRDWQTKYRGPVLIHASKGMTFAEYEDASLFARRCRCRVAVPPREELQRGGIVGQAEIVDCVSGSDSPWFVGDYAFVLRNAKPLPFVPYRGALGFFDVPCDVLKGKESED
jgi:hypothetical protein